MAHVKFKRGSTANVPTSGATEGTFYIDNTNGNMYLGNADGTTSQLCKSTNQAAYVVCTTEASTMLKNITLPTGYVTANGSILAVKFTNGNTSSSVFFPVAGGTALRVNGSTTIPNDLIKANNIVTMVFISSSSALSYWDIINIVDSDGKTSLTIDGNNVGQSFNILMDGSSPTYYSTIKAFALTSKVTSVNGMDGEVTGLTETFPVTVTFTVDPNTGEISDGTMDHTISEIDDAISDGKTITVTSTATGIGTAVSSSVVYQYDSSYTYGSLNILASLNDVWVAGYTYITDDPDNNTMHIDLDPFGVGNCYSATNPPPYPVTSVNNQTGDVTLTYSDVGADASGAAATVQGNVDTLAGRVTTIEGDIPSAASSSNQLADKNFVNSSIATNTANFIGTFNSVADLEAYSGTVTNNDYAFVIGTDSAGNTEYKRYKYTASTTSWSYEYTLNNSSFTADQWAAINSTITSSLVTSYSGHVADSTIHVTSANKSTWNAKYDKPTNGIPRSDLDSATQLSLVPFGTCSTGASTQKKVVTISEITSLTAGTSIRVKFTNNQSYNGTPTLQLNSFDAKSIMRNGETAAARYEWIAGEVVDFVYDGTYWLIANGAIATTTYYGYTKLTDSATSTSTATALVPASLYKYSRYAIAGCAAYSSSATYAVGDLVLYSFYIYECNTAITTAEAWNADHWTQLDPILTQVRAKYTKPTNGIPSTDMASAVQTSLGKADSAIQGIKVNGTTVAPDANKVVDITVSGGSSTVYGTITLSTSWTQDATISTLYYQVVTSQISGVTSNSKIDLQPDATVITQLFSDGITALYAVQDNAAVTVYALGAQPTASMNIQYTMTEISANSAS